MRPGGWIGRSAGARWRPHGAQPNGELHPRAPDYLFLSFITVSQFGPADTLILTRRAKLVVALQAILALISIVVIAGRAINIINP